jgi:DNA-binding transcriptional ArsR family regulator
MLSMFRKIAANELAKFIQPLTHSIRIHIIEELRAGELSVSSIQKIIGIPQASVSQHLAILKTHHLIKERKEGRRVFYSLVAPEIAEWLLQGIDLMGKSKKLDQATGEAMISAKESWPA